MDSAYAWALSIYGHPGNKHFSPILISVCFACQTKGLECLAELYMLFRTLMLHTCNDVLSIKHMPYQEDQIHGISSI